MMAVQQNYKKNKILHDKIQEYIVVQANPKDPFLGTTAAIIVGIAAWLPYGWLPFLAVCHYWLWVLQKHGPWSAYGYLFLGCYGAPKSLGQLYGMASHVITWPSWTSWPCPSWA